MIIYRSSCHEADLDIIRTNDQFLFYCNECGRICELEEIEVAIDDRVSIFDRAFFHFIFCSCIDRRRPSFFVYHKIKMKGREIFIFGSMIF